MIANDGNILARWIGQHDAEAFRTIVVRHSGMVYATCVRILGNRVEAQDVTQECFASLSQATRVPAEDLGPWLHRVATNLALKHIRGEQRRKLREVRFAEQQPDHAESDIDWDNICGHIDAAILELPEDLRVVVVKYFLEQMTQKTVARQLGVSRQTVSWRLQRGIIAIRETLGARGIVVPVAALSVAMSSQLAQAAPLAPSLAAKLGKMALAQCIKADTAGKSAHTAYFTIGGIVIMKKALVILVLLVVAVGVWLTLGQSNAGLEAVETEVSMVEAATSEPDAGPAMESLPPVSAPEAPTEPTPSAIVAVTPETSISGHTLDEESGTGIPGVTVTASWGDPSHPEVATATSAADGSYRITGLTAPSGTSYTLRRDAPLGYQLAAMVDRKTVVLDDDGQASGLDFTLRREVALQGVVVDSRNRPVAGADVQLVGAGLMGIFEVWNSSATRVRSADNGSFAFSNLPATNLGIVARSGEQFSSQPYTFTLPAEGITDLVLVLDETCAITGSVLDETGNPLQGILVSCRPSYSRTLSHPDGTTDSSGKFEVSGLAAGAYELVAMKPGRAIAGAHQKGVPVELAPGRQLTDVILVYSRSREMATISGQVVNLDGNPIAGAIVLVGSAFLGGDRTKSDEVGRFVVTDLENGTYEVDARAEGFQPVNVAEVEAGTSDLQIILPEPFRITGRVTDAASGQPLPEFEIVLGRSRGTEFDSMSERYFQKFSEPDGRFELAQPQPSSSILAARAPGYATALEFLDLTGPPYAHEVDLRLERGADVEGKVVNSQGTPIAGASVFWGEVVTFGDFASAQSANDGTFHLASAPHQPQLVSAWHPEYAPGSIRIDGVSTRPVEIVLTEGGIVEGVVSFADGTTPKPGNIRVVYPEGHEVPQEGQADVAEDGTFQIVRVQPGDVEVTLYVKDGANLEKQTILSQWATVQAGATTTVDFHVQAWHAALQGVIDFPRGALPTRVLLTLKLQTSEGTVSQTIFAGFDGGFRFEGLPPGEGEVAIDAMFQNHTRIATNVPVQVLNNDDSYIEVPL